MLNKDIATKLARLAVAKALNEKATKEAREGASVGAFLVDTTVRLKGTLNVAEDTTATKPAELKPWDIIAVLASKVNEATLKAVAKEVVMAYREEREVKGVKEAKAAVDSVVVEMKEETRDVRKGAVKYTGGVEIIKQSIVPCVS